MSQEEPEKGGGCAPIATILLLLLGGLSMLATQNAFRVSQQAAQDNLQRSIQSQQRMRELQLQQQQERQRQLDWEIQRLGR